MSDNTALAPVADRPALELLEEDSLQKFARLLKKLLPGGDKLSDEEALAGAAYARTSGLNPFIGEFYIVPKLGVVEGYRAPLKNRNPDVRYRPLSQDEREWHDIQPGDKAVICEARDPAAAVAARRAGQEPPVTLGVGIVRKAEQWVSYEWATARSGKKYRKPLPEEKWTRREEPPRGRSWGWVAQNRALKDAMRHMGIAAPESPEEILATARAAGVPLPEVPDTARLTSGQAETIVEQAQLAAKAKARGEETPHISLGLTDMPAPMPDSLDVPPDETLLTASDSAMAAASEHWIKDAATQKSFLNWCKKKQLLTGAEVSQALGVESLGEFTGTKQEAKAKVVAYSNAKIDEDIREAEEQRPLIPEEEVE